MSEMEVNSLSASYLTHDDKMNSVLPNLKKFPTVLNINTPDDRNILMVSLDDL